MIIIQELRVETHIEREPSVIGNFYAFRRSSLIPFFTAGDVHEVERHRRACLLGIQEELRFALTVLAVLRYEEIRIWMQSAGTINISIRDVHIHRIDHVVILRSFRRDAEIKLITGINRPIVGVNELCDLLA